jgi:hypothetical protein
VEKTIVEIATGCFGSRPVINRAVKRLVIVVVEFVSEKIGRVPVLWVFEIDVAGVEETSVAPVARARVIGEILPEEERLPTTVLVPKIAFGLTRI